MKKVLFNTFWFVPIVIFGCFNAPFAGKDSNTLTQQEIQYKLDTRSQAIINKYGNTIRKYSDYYGVDWRLVMAVMKVESQFNHSAESHRGAKGFMQIMPATQAEIAEKIGIGSESIDDPHGNIRGGIYYLSRLYKLYGQQGLDNDNQLKLALAAYNAGPGRIFDAQKMALYVNDNPKDWKAVKKALPLLSKKYSSLHKFVWEEKKPSNGYFNGWRQTNKYVESVLGEYYGFKKALTS